MSISSGDYDIAYPSAILRNNYSIIDSKSGIIYL